jgi:hypothetical protein
VGRSKAELEGQPITCVPDLCLDTDLIATALATNTPPPNAERLLTRPDGTSVWVALIFHMPSARFATPRSLLLGLQVCRAVARSRRGP